MGRTIRRLAIVNKILKPDVISPSKKNPVELQNAADKYRKAGLLAMDAYFMTAAGFDLERIAHYRSTGQNLRAETEALARYHEETRGPFGSDKRARMFAYAQVSNLVHEDRYDAAKRFIQNGIAKEEEELNAHKRKLSRLAKKSDAAEAQRKEIESHKEAIFVYENLIAVIDEEVERLIENGLLPREE